MMQADKIELVDIGPVRAAVINGILLCMVMEPDCTRIDQCQPDPVKVIPVLKTAKGS
jgi:hypothetical protein